MQCRNGHYSGSQKDPTKINTENRKQCISRLKCVKKKESLQWSCICVVAREYAVFILRVGGLFSNILTARPDTWGSRFSSGTSTSSIRIIPVAEALRENLPSILGVLNPFIPLSRINPLTLPSSHFAQTTQISAYGELVILFREKKKKVLLSFTCAVCLRFMWCNVELIFYILPDIRGQD